MDDEQPHFKVTDRRLFNADGSPRALPPEETPAPKPVTPEPVASEPVATAPSVEEVRQSVPPQEALDAAASADEENELSEEELEGAHDPASFVNFLMSIASNAASALGMMEHPVTHQREVDLELAKHWIDVLGMLQRKTQGNLSTQEAKILEGFLADLRMQFVSLANSATPKAARTYSGRDIVGG